MKKLVWMLLFFPLFAIADTKDIVMDWLRINAQYEVKPTEWHKKNDTWMVDFTTKKNEQMKVAVTGNRVAIHSVFPQPITDMFFSGCASISSEVIPEAGYWDENATENTKALNQFWKDKGWSESTENKEVIIDGWKITAYKKPAELSCVIEAVSI
ncbi:hypothetical protein [Morganella morganii]|uniref:hypothetical protein n=1 Tax=Morganella morganii TaxID=582 RepID=UPI003A873617